MDRQIVVFILACQQYGLDIGQVYEIIRWEKPVRLPQTAPSVEGVIHLRERIIPVVDLVARLGLSPAAAGCPDDPGGSEQVAESSRIVVVDAGGAMVGLQVDAVQEVRVLPAGSFQPPPRRMAAGGYVEAIALDGDRMVIMLDLRELFSGEEAVLRTAAGKDDTEVADVV